MTPDELRAEFPVTERVAYLNAGTCGPIPRASVAAVCEAAERAAIEGRTGAHFAEAVAVAERLRGAYAALLGAAADDVALTTATSEGIVRVLLGLDLLPGDEILVAEGEHPGLLGPLAAVRTHRRVTCREVPLAEIAGAVGPRTRLVACSHVAWTTGALAPDLSQLDVPVLLDGAQAAGAIEVDVRALNCAFYAAAGQKWLCGPVGTGLLYVAPAWRERLGAVGPTFVNLVSPADGLAATPWPDARAHDAPALSLDAAAGALAAHDTLAGFGWDAVHSRARGLAATVADALIAAGHDVAPRGDTTLVSWRSPDPAAEVERAAAAGVVLRSFPGLPWVRASVGAWNDERDLERLLALDAPR